jgi:tripartite-type tricarboxylate transporter receptor subunit TctC
LTAVILLQTAGSDHALSNVKNDPPEREIVEAGFQQGDTMHKQVHSPVRRSLARTLMPVMAGFAFALSAAEYITAVKAAGPSKFKMGGTGSKQEDQIITVGLEKATGTKFIYVPYKGGGEVAVQLVGGHINSTVNNPIEAVAQWRAGKLRALCVFDENRMHYKEKVTDTQSWSDIPTCKEAGVPTSYTMLRGIFMAPGVTPDQVAFYVDLLKKVRETPDWKEYMEKGAFNATTMTGNDYKKWLEDAEKAHHQLMSEAGFLAAK